MYRYNNVQTKHMKEVTREKNRDGNTIIFVQKCDNFTNRMFKYTKEKLIQYKLKKILDNSIKTC